MKNFSIFFVLFLFVLGCSGPLQEEIEPTTLKSGKMVERTIKFQKATGIMEVLTGVEACTDYGLQMLITGSGNATHLGLFTVINTTCLDDELNPVSPLMGEITAANGDMIYTIVLEEPWVEDGLVYYRYTIRTELCTGRFEGASGYFIMYGIIDYDNMSWNLKGEGKITY